MNDIAVARVGDASAVRMPRRVDVTNTQAFVDAVRAESGRVIVLDFSGTETIDSTALGAIVQIYKALRAEQRDLRIAGVSDTVRCVFSITRLDRVFDIFDTPKEAIEAGNNSS